jgi:dTDP-4-dehydrorhamnose reductase
MSHTPVPPPPLALWGGVEATVNRVGERYFSQMELNGHAARADDLNRFAALGITALRYPVLWELVAPDGVAHADWRWPDERLHALRELGITPIAGLVHHGSGPRHTSLIDPDFATGLADYAGAVARRYPWLDDYTPVNEPCTTARFSCLYGLWHPHRQDDASFVRAVLVQCKATVLAMQAIRAVNPRARLVQTDDLGKAYGTAVMAEQVKFYNHRRWLGWDLLCGMVGPDHALWRYLLKSGATEEELLWFREHPCPPDIIGINYYITSERWLDHRIELYDDRDVGAHGYADVAAARSMDTPCPGIAPLLQEAWERYGLPLAVTEAHLDAQREDQVRWLHEIWQGAQQARQAGADVRAVTVWALLGAFDWNSLVTQRNLYYESGAFDLRGPQPRPTAVATLMRELAAGQPPSSPALDGQGWWRHPERLLHAAMDGQPDGNGDSKLEREQARPILISSGGGKLGNAFAQLCGERHLACIVLTRQQMDITDAASVSAALARHQPWAVVNTSGYVHAQRIGDDAAPGQRIGDDPALCQRESTLGPVVLAQACARLGIQLLNFSSDQVFDGRQDRPQVESDPLTPGTLYGANEAEAEQRALAVHPGTLIMRTSALFGPWDRRNFVTRVLQALASGRTFSANGDQIVTPTYVPDLVHACLNLLIDGEAGIWHISHETALSWSQLAHRVAALAGLPAELIVEDVAPSPGAPRHSGLVSERGHFMPPLDAALRHFIEILGVSADGCYNCAPWPGSSVGRAED